MRRDTRWCPRAGRVLLATFVTLFGTSGCKPLDDVMVALAGRSMRDSRSFDPYENTRSPHENSVSFSSGNYPAAPGTVNIGQPEIGAYVPPMTQADVVPPGTPVVQSLVNPVPADAASLARGQVVFDRVCAACHSQSGVSAEAAIAARFQAVVPWNLATGASTGYSDGYIYAIIRVGRGAMPAYGHQITHFDRWHVVNYLRTLQQAAGAGGPDGAGDTGGGAGGTTGGEG